MRTNQNRSSFLFSSLQLICTHSRGKTGRIIAFNLIVIVNKTRQRRSVNYFHQYSIFMWNYFILYFQIPWHKLKLLTTAYQTLRKLPDRPIPRLQTRFSTMHVWKLWSLPTQVRAEFSTIVTLLLKGRRPMSCFLTQWHQRNQLSHKHRGAEADKCSESCYVEKGPSNQGKNTV